MTTRRGRKKNTIPSYDRILAAPVNRANFSRPSMLGIPSHLACHSPEDKEPRHSTSRINVTSTRRPIRLHKGSMSCGSSKAEREKEKKEEGKEEEEGSNVAETAKRIRWISGRVVSRKIDPPASQPVVSRLLATVSEPR